MVNRRVLIATEAGHSTKLDGFNPIVRAKKVFSDVISKHLSEYHRVVGFIDGYDLGRFALHRDGRFGYARGFLVGGRYLCQPGNIKLVVAV